MSVKDNVRRIHERIQNKIISAGIEYPITLMAVTKTVPALEVIEALESGITVLGENRVQEAEKKFVELGGLNVEKHLIGHLQENKANKAAVLFDAIDSIDSMDIAEKINRKLAESGKTMPVMIEINTSGEESKFGIKAPEVEELAGRILQMKQLILSGLMTIGPLDKPESEVRKAFRLLYNTRERLKSAFPSSNIKTLSMGMSHDFEIAIEEGSNLVRLGTILFGERNYQ